MKRTLLALTLVVLAAGPALSAVWLDSATPANWNVAGAPMPSAPGTPDPELKPGGRCASFLRHPTTHEDRAAAHKGWSLIGPYERYGRTSVLMVTSSADGMCRPEGYQAFVFVDEHFAGTLSPHLMDARTDASLGSLSIGLSDERDLNAAFLRYSSTDALCCPHATTNVDYKVSTLPTNRVVRPVSAATTPNSP